MTDYTALQANGKHEIINVNDEEYEEMLQILKRVNEMTGTDYKNPAGKLTPYRVNPPTIEDLENHHVRAHIKEYLPYLIYFGSPDLYVSNDPKFKEVRKYINNILAEQVVFIDVNTRVRNAVENTKKQQCDYWDEIIERRIGEDTGCYPAHDKASLENAIMSAEWEPAKHPGIQEGCRGYRTTDIGVSVAETVPLTDLPDDVMLEVTKCKGGYVGIRAYASDLLPSVKETNETWIMIGESEQKTEVVQAIWPGEPLRASEIKVKGIRPGTRITKEKAIKAGFEFVKIE